MLLEPEKKKQDSLCTSFVIETHRLSKTYKNIAALQPLNLRIPRNTICGFLGPNGAGKSTTIKLLLGLIRPTSGSGRIFGYDIVRENLAIRQKVGYLAQDPHFYDYMTARETLHFVARFFYTGPHSAIEDRVAEALEIVRLTDKADRPIKGFSGGERQRLGIAQAQINHPDLLILDEPAASLDPIGRRDVLEVMQNLRQYTTIFFSTHLLDDVQRVSDMIAILKQGELIVQAPIDKLLVDRNSPVYELILQGDIQHVYAQVSCQPWVSTISVLSKPDQIVWEITVTDEQSAQERLLPLVAADSSIRVIGFGRKKQALEDIFVTLVEGENNER